MKRIVLLLMVVLAMGCSKSEEKNINTSSNKNNELYKITDYFARHSHLDF